MEPLGRLLTMNAFLNIQFGEIEKDKSQSDIQVFFEHNGLDRTYSEFPKAKLTPGFVHLSEDVLLDTFPAMDYYEAEDTSTRDYGSHEARRP